jgi:hypothetical protein
MHWIVSYLTACTTFWFVKTDLKKKENVVRIAIVLDILYWGSIYISKINCEIEFRVYPFGW